MATERKLVAPNSFSLRSVLNSRQHEQRAQLSSVHRQLFIAVREQDKEDLMSQRTYDVLLSKVVRKAVDRRLLGV
jgi:hypothetical protein